MQPSDRSRTRRTCGARTRAGTPCQLAPVVGNRRCRLHGGKSLAGEAHPNYKHGCRSKDNTLRALAYARIMRGEVAPPSRPVPCDDVALYMARALVTTPVAEVPTCTPRRERLSMERKVNALLASLPVSLPTLLRG
jgi:hypothetical protein